MKRALFLTGGKTTPASRFRVHQYLPRLRADGWEAVVRPCEPAMYDWPAPGGLFGKWRRFVALAKKVSHQKRSMRDAATFDVVYVERELMPYLSPRLERRLASRNKNIVYDIDDSVFLKYGDRKPNPIAEVMRLARTVIAGNQWLLEWALPHNPNSHLIPTPIDTERWSPAAPRTPFMPNGQEWPLVVVWTGSSGNLPMLQPIAAALAKAKARVPRMSFRVVCDRPPADSLFPDTQFVPWSELAEVEAVRSADVGLMPLPDDVWSKGKCGFKLEQYMACGLPGIASPVGVNADMLDGGCGLLARGADEWEEALVRLLTDAVMRREMGAKARSRAVHRYSVEAMYPIWKAAIESAVV
ncbi:MAG: glycosyltransferase family 4 protein [Planctomycetes bacterium]|nr:glycosyltransferase family 4 protein [Planctomycetota bacterium]